MTCLKHKISTVFLYYLAKNQNRSLPILGPSKVKAGDKGRPLKLIQDFGRNLDM